MPATAQQLVLIRAALAEAGYPDVEPTPSHIYVEPGPRPWCPPVIAWAAVELAGVNQGCWPCTAQDLAEGGEKWTTKRACAKGSCSHLGEPRWPDRSLLFTASLGTRTVSDRTLNGQPTVAKSEAIWPECES